MGRKEKYQAAAEKYLPTIKRICAANGAPYQVCFAQLMVESGGSGVLAERHNYFGIKYPRGRNWKALWEWLGQPGKVVKLTNEKIKIKSEAHMMRYLAKGAVFKDEKWAANPTYPSRQAMRLPQAFCAWDSLEFGVEGWCRFMSKKRYQDGGVLTDWPVRWIAYRWMRGYATATGYVPAVVKRMNRVHQYTGDKSFLCEIDEDLEDLIDIALLYDGSERHDFAKDALEDNGFQRVPYEVFDFSNDPIVIEA